MELIHVDARGDACPIPVVKTKAAIAKLNGEGTVETLVDNETAVQNLTKMAHQKGYGVTSEKQNDSCYRVSMTIQEQEDNDNAPEKALSQPMVQEQNTVVVISADHMGEGDDELGRTLLKGFIFALVTQEERPRTILFYNGGARLTCEGSDSLEDLCALAEQGVELLTCGTCMNFYGLTDKLAVGGVTNMYEIVEKQMKATLVVRP